MVSVYSVLEVCADLQQRAGGPLPISDAALTRSTAPAGRGAGG